MNNHLVSIIIAAYNAEPFIAKCLDSVLNQTYMNLEIVIIDDASTDATLSIIENYSAKDPRIVFTSLKFNSGTPAARNRGYEICTGEYIASVDADDTIAPDTVERCVEELANDPELDLITFKMMMVYPDTGKTITYPINPSVPEVMTGEEACYWSIDYDFAPNGMTRATFDKNIPSETEYGQYGDETTTHLLLLNARKVKLGQGLYYFFQWSESRTHKFSILRFEILECRLSLKRQLMEMGQSRKETLDILERKRWREFIDMCYLYFKHRGEMTKSEREDIFHRLHNAYYSIDNVRLPLKTVLKPGYMRLPSFIAFYIQLCILLYIKTIYKSVCSCRK